MQLSIHDNWWEGIRDLPKDRQDAFLGIMARYFFINEDPPQLSGVEAAVWGVLRKLIDDSKSGQLNGKKGGDGRGNTRGKSGENEGKTPTEKGSKKPPTKTPLDNKKPPEKTPEENPPFIKEKKEGRVLSNNNKTHSLRAQDAAGGSSPATPSAEELQQIFDEVDATIPDPFDIKDPDPGAYEVRDMAAYLEAFNAETDEPSTPCPPEILAAVKGGAA